MTRKQRRLWLIYEKTHNITKDNMDKIGETIEKVMNENSGLVCLIV